MANLINKENYGYTPLEYKSGTFTPNIELDTGSHVDVQQIGNVVFVHGMIYPKNATLADISGKYGTIGGVDAPTTLFVPVMTYDGNDTFHSGVMGVIGVLGNIELYGASLTGTDVGVLFDFFYIA